MSDMKIEDAVQDSDISGAEKLPVSDAGAAKCMTIGQIKDFVIGRIGALARDGAVDISENAVYLNRDGTLVPVSASVFANAILSFAFGKAGSSVLDGNETFSIKNGTMLQSVTLTQIKTWLQDEMSKTQIAALDTAGALADGNLSSVSQGGTDKKVTLALLKAFCLAGLYARSEASTDPISDDDEILCFKSGTLCKVKRSDAGLPDGDVKAFGSPIGSAIPTWSGDGKSLTPGYEIAEEISETYGGQQRIPTEMAVRGACDKLGDVKANGTVTVGNIPVWADGKKLSSGMSVAKSINDLSSDSEVPTAKAVNDALKNVKTPEVSQSLVEVPEDSVPTVKAVKDGISEAETRCAPKSIVEKVELLDAMKVAFLEDVHLDVDEPLEAEGYPTGTFAVAEALDHQGSSRPRLYLNLGSAESPGWVFVATLSSSHP